MKRLIFTGLTCAALLMSVFTLHTIQESPLLEHTDILEESPYEVAPLSVVLENDISEQPWSKEEVTVLAKTVYGEAVGVKSKMEQAAVVWCVLNRCDAYEKDILEVATAPKQFVGYRDSNPVTDELYSLCEDVLSRWYAEKNGATDVGRVLPIDYLYFSGDGKHNHFRNEFKTNLTWDWGYPNPYET